MDDLAKRGDFQAMRIGFCVGFGLHSIDGDDDDVLDRFGGGRLRGVPGFYGECLCRGEVRAGDGRGCSCDDYCDKNEWRDSSPHRRCLREVVEYSSWRGVRSTSGCRKGLRSSRSKTDREGPELQVIELI